MGTTSSLRRTKSSGLQNSCYDWKWPYTVGTCSRGRGWSELRILWRAQSSCRSNAVALAYTVGEEGQNSSISLLKIKMMPVEIALDFATALFLERYSCLWPLRSQDLSKGTVARLSCQMSEVLSSMKVFRFILIESPLLARERHCLL